MKYLVLVMTIFATQFSNIYAIPEAEVTERFMSQLIPYVQNTYQQSYFWGTGRVKINYYSNQLQNPEGVIIISPGQSEASLKYAELLYDLKNLNYDIFIIDHRGQGLSERLLDDPIKSHVEKFSYYVDDFSFFVNSIVQAKKYKKSFVLAHSMGGAIAAGFLTNHPNSVSAAILSAPMFEINTGYIGNKTTEIIARLLDLGFSTSYAPSQRPYSSEVTFTGNIVSTSYPRYRLRKDLYNAIPALQVGGTSVNWLKESLIYTENLRSLKNNFKVPVLLLQAGHDQFVWSQGQNEVCEINNQRLCRIVRQGFEKSEHEILMEKDIIRNHALNLIETFILQTP